MSETSIALISAGGAILGAITGGAVTGFTTVRNTHIQTQSQRDSEHIAREHEQLNRHRDLRRSAYIEFLQSATEVYEKCGSALLLAMTDADFQGALTAASDATFDLNRRLVVVTLEGPPEISRIANKYTVDMLRYVGAIVSFANTPPSGIELTQPARLVLDSLLESEEEEVNQSQGQFVRAAREALGGHL
ncbi:hypothetical protein ACWEIK_02550 [Streptomyces sp. NPDC004673]